jgi:hypothetical protein
MLLFLCLLIFIISACSSKNNNAAPAVASTPYPTYTLYPTFTPVVTKTPTITPTSHYHPITWNELNDFLASDHTNWHAYIPDKYVCVNFAMDLVAHAEEQNIESWIVVVSFEHADAGHAFVGFSTTDKGTVWIEPQSDYAYAAVEVGQPLCWKIDPTRCQDWGIVYEVHDHAMCSYIQHYCWW